ncbi:neuronal PAS domain-containing protein 4-like [Hemibagrus wyckioides]|uniref:neuronal PAS domain-containing protein 4-like n=1 Tax=Hemibagrus wyckioides TaxID=337641 RepID=UPI00266BCF59|nr:neuronal PAS domain-containing protein 4-like [Hemibagrus wyckioides]
MTLGHSILNYSPSSSSCSSSFNSSSPGARGSIRKNRKFRSTKGASKARRDLINAEIRKLRALLPISAEDRERLSYLHTMSVICTFIRKSVLLERDGVCVAGGGDEGVIPACEDLLNALPGFLVAMTREGKLLYVSENVSHYLGLSMVEVLQGDTFYSMITNSDTEKIKFYLQDENLNTERSCVCSFRTNRQSCPLLVRLRVLDPQKCLVVALCLPSSMRERDSFTTMHTPDMKYTHTHYSVEIYLGYEAEELIGRSWYSIIHPDDLLLSARGHKQLMQCEQVDLVLRVQDKQLNWVWLYIIATRDTQSHMITCSNYIISEVVAEELRHKLCTVSSVSAPPSLSLPVSQNSHCSTKRPPEVGAESKRRKNKRVSTAAESSLPYSPNSSFTSPAQETGNIDFLSSSSAFCPFYPSPPQNIQWPGFDSTFSTPFCYHTEVSVSEDHAQLPSLSDTFLYLDDFNSFPVLVTGSSRTFHAPEDYGWSGLLTSHPPALRYSEMEQVEISILAQQISSLASSFDSYCTKSSTHRSDHTPGSPSCDPEAFLLDEEVIDSVMQFPRAMLEVQTLEALLDIEKCTEEQQHEFSLYSHTQQDGFCDESLY